MVKDSRFGHKCGRSVQWQLLASRIPKWAQLKDISVRDGLGVSKRRCRPGEHDVRNTILRSGRKCSAEIGDSVEIGATVEPLLMKSILSFVHGNNSAAPSISSQLKKHSSNN